MLSPTALALVCEGGCRDRKLSDSTSKASHIRVADMGHCIMLYAADCTHASLHVGYLYLGTALCSLYPSATRRESV